MKPASQGHSPISSSLFPVYALIPRVYGVGEVAVFGGGGVARGVFFKAVVQ